MLNHEDIRLIIAKRKEELGLTWEEVAEKAGVSRSTLMKYGAGQHELRLSMVCRVICVLGMKLDIRLADGKELNKRRYGHGGADAE